MTGFPTVHDIHRYWQILIDIKNRISKHSDSFQKDILCEKIPRGWARLHSGCQLCFLPTHKESKHNPSLVHILDSETLGRSSHVHFTSFHIISQRFLIIGGHPSWLVLLVLLASANQNTDSVHYKCDVVPGHA